uniref:Uncharacterized protein n=1 Tax=viral metagenome TaxID=1070528 RepID=A0A6C0C2G7_9ZZZZ
MARHSELFDSTPNDSDDNVSDQSLGEWSDSSDDSDDDTADDYQPSMKSDGKNTQQLFATAPMQSSVHTMLTHLQEWWEHSEQLLQMMAAKQLPCSSLKKMSDEIDTMLDKAISKLIETYSSDPSVFPVAAIISTTRAIKKYLFLKVGEVCCQVGKEDACAKMANVSLVSLKKFRNSATDFYDQLLAHLVQSMEAATTTKDDEAFSTPDLQNLLSELTVHSSMPDGKKATQKPTKSKTSPKKSPSSKAARAA